MVWGSILEISSRRKRLIPSAWSLLMGLSRIRMSVNT